MFQYFPKFREGNFLGTIVSQNKIDGYEEYELKLPTDVMFTKVYGEIVVHYTVYHNQKIVMFKTIEFGDLGYQKELTTYKGVPVSKSHAEKDMFKINIINMLEK